MAANLRMAAIGPQADVQPAEIEEGSPTLGRGKVICAGEVREAVVTDRRSLGDGIAGPAVLSDPDSTVYVPPGWRAERGPAGSVLLRKEEA